jgi:putative acetyltransferase
MTITTYPDAVDPDKVGEYPSLTSSGGGRFYDDVLEYRVWCHPGDGDDYYCCFETYAEALKFSRGRHWTNKIKEEPIVVVRQLEWVSEDEDGVRSHETGERITEWRTEWLDGSKRTEDSVRDFLAKEGV